MTLILTGSPTRFGEDHFTTDNGLLAAVRAALPPAPHVLLVSAAPDDRKFTDYVLDSMSACIRNSGITPASVTMLDRRNAGLASGLVHGADWVILCGGHVPTQNRFLHEIGLRELLRGFGGLVMGCSAGSMNCAERVFSHPELPGEAADPQYPRWLEGLGLTTRQLVPHYDQVRHAVIDAMRSSTAGASSRTSSSRRAGGIPSIHTRTAATSCRKTAARPSSAPPGRFPTDRCGRFLPKTKCIPL